MFFTHINSFFVAEAIFLSIYSSCTVRDAYSKVKSKQEQENIGGELISMQQSSIAAPCLHVRNPIAGAQSR